MMVGTERQMMKTAFLISFYCYRQLCRYFFGKKSDSSPAVQSKLTEYVILF